MIFQVSNTHNISSVSLFNAIRILTCKYIKISYFNFLNIRHFNKLSFFICYFFLFCSNHINWVSSFDFSRKYSSKSQRFCCIVLAIQFVKTSFIKVFSWNINHLGNECNGWLVMTKRACWQSFFNFLTYGILLIIEIQKIWKPEILSCDWIRKDLNDSFHCYDIKR